MITSRSASLLSLAAIVFFGGARASAVSDCDFWPGKYWGGSYSSKPFVSVWLNSSAAGILGVTSAAMDQAVRHATSIINEDSGATIKLRYRGTTTSTNISGAIVIRGSTACQPNNLYGQTFVSGSGTSVTAAQIDLYRKLSNCAQYSWRTDDEGIFPHDVVSGLIHELGHAGLLLDDIGEDTCPDIGQVSVMRCLSCTPATRVLKHYDTSRTQQKLMPRSLFSQVQRRTWDPTVSVWGTVGGWAKKLEYRMSSVSQNSVYPVAAWTETQNGGGPNVRKELYNESINPPWMNSEAFVVVSEHPAGAAADNSIGDALLVYLTGETIYSDVKTICYRRSTDFGQTFGAETCPSDANGYYTTNRNGVTVGHDPRSDAFVVGWNFDNKELRFLTVPVTGSTTPQAFTALSNQSWDAPSIACRNAAYGCRIAYEDRSTDGCLKWIEAQVSLTTGAIQPSTTRTQCWYQYDTPSIAYNQIDDTYYLAFQQSNHAIYAMSMPATGTSWSGMPDVHNNTNTIVGAPALGTDYLCLFGCRGSLTAFYPKYW